MHDAGNECVVLPDGRAARLITRSDYKTGVLSQQVHMMRALRHAAHRSPAQH